MPAGRQQQRLVASRLSPFASLGPDIGWLVAVEFAPQPAHQADAVTAGLADAGPVVIRRAQPATGEIYNLYPLYCHRKRLPPVLLPSPVLG